MTWGLRRRASATCWTLRRRWLRPKRWAGHDTTDVLTISISSTDILGHKVGPDAPEQRAMIDAIDGYLNAFFTWLDKNVDGGVGNVWVSLTGDHGVGPTIPGAAAAGFPAATYSLTKALTALDAALNARFSPGQQLKYMLASSLPQVTLDPRTFASLKIDEATAESAVAELLPAAFESRRCRRRRMVRFRCPRGQSCATSIRSWRYRRGKSRRRPRAG